MKSVPKTAPRTEAQYHDHASIIAQHHLRLTPQAHAVIIKRMHQENPRLAELVVDQVRQLRARKS